MLNLMKTIPVEAVLRFYDGVEEGFRYGKIESFESRADEILADMREKHPETTFIVHNADKSVKDPLKRQYSGTWQVRGNDAELVAELTEHELLTDKNGVPYVVLESNDEVNEVLRTLVSNGVRAGILDAVVDEEQSKRRRRITEKIAEASAENDKAASHRADNEDVEKPTKAEQAMVEGLAELMRNAGIEVSLDWKEG